MERKNHSNETSRKYKVKNGASENIRLTDFIDKYLEDYARLYLKPKTFESYEMNLRAIRHALGHILVLYNNT